MLETSPLRFLARLGLAWLALTAALSLLGARAGAPLLPLVRFGLELVQSDVEVHRLSVANDAVQVRATVKPGSLATLAVPVGQLLQGPVLVWSLLFAWPHRSRGLRVTAFLVALPLLVAAETLDAPFALAAGIDQALGRTRPLAAFWWFFLDNGGRLLLSVLVAPAAVWGAELLHTKPRTSLPRSRP
ncbi:MAG: hypothetical protein ACOZQL_36325 [Myxococcota bacterium]